MLLTARANILISGDKDLLAIPSGQSIELELAHRFRWRSRKRLLEDEYLVLLELELHKSCAYLQRTPCQQATVLAVRQRHVRDLQRRGSPFVHRYHDR